MKALTIWQPWASLIAISAKKFETRSWATSYRGPIAIHAAAKKYDIRAIPARAVYSMVKAIKPITRSLAKTTMYVPMELLPRGKIIATAELVGCHEIVGVGKGWSTTEIRAAWLDSELKPHFPTEQELLFGDWASGNFAWEIANVKMLDKPIPAKGKQRLWEWEGQNE